MQKIFIRLSHGEAISLDYELMHLLGFEKSTHFFHEGKAFIPKKRNDIDVGATVGRDDANAEFFCYKP
jgi:hypothetical protein